ncbi:hypothetical protein BGZ73_007550 [Actinomortierella ambigua]|nr:hypothetical protein BGZ73_007550 [Actinomortierella ambigua]
MSQDTSTPHLPDEELRNLVQCLTQQLQLQQAEIQQLKADRDGDLKIIPGRVDFKQPRATTLRLYDELLEVYPAIGEPNFFDAELPKDHQIFDWNDFHYTQGMEYEAPSILQQSEFSLPRSAEQHDHDLATIQGYIANTTRMYDSLAHEIIDMGEADSELGKRVLDYLNVAQISMANDASKISHMRRILLTTVSVKGDSTKGSSIPTVLAPRCLAQYIGRASLQRFVCLAQHPPHLV